jgi:hypothetical protein
MPVVVPSPAKTKSSVLSLPHRLEERSSRFSRLAHLMFLLPIAAALAAATTSIAISAVIDPAVRDLAWTHPTAGLLGLCGLALVMAMFGWPAVRRALDVIGSRSIEIADGAVAVTLCTPFGTDIRTEPLSRFDGLAHVIRTRIGGTHHELVLVHPDRARSVRIARADRFTKDDVDAACAVLGLGEVPARALYERGREGGMASPALVGRAPAAA